MRRATSQQPAGTTRTTYFYPRSPCGERRIIDIINNIVNDFYPRSPCGERPQKRYPAILGNVISIHALLAESDRFCPTCQWRRSVFLSTLSLRRATFGCWMALNRPLFLSTLSLRRATGIHFDNYNLHCVISIHALLAESDRLYRLPLIALPISIHALLAESDWLNPTTMNTANEFLSTLSLRRAT